MNKFLAQLSFLIVFMVSVNTSFAGSHEKKAEDAVETKMEEKKSDEAELAKAKKDDEAEKKEEVKKKEGEEDEEPDCD